MMYRILQGLLILLFTFVFIFTVFIISSFFIIEDDENVKAAKRNTQDGVVTVMNDGGGALFSRARHVWHINRKGLTVRIVGRRCASACTFYLGVRDVCTTPKTSFYFHGPAERGGADMTSERVPVLLRALSYVPAYYYPEPLRSAYLSEYRHFGRNEFHLITGKELIEAGHIRAC